MSESETTVASPLPSLIHGVEEAACTALGIARLRHRSALHSLIVTDDIDLARLVRTVIASNWLACNADANRDRSRQNWRWELQSQINPANRSPEVVLERALAMAGKSGGSSDWANQIPVASGLVAGATDGRRAIDLGLRSGERIYELIELKIASDTPLYAAVELLGYASLLLLARRNPPNNRPELLNAKRIDLRVLAPAPPSTRRSTSWPSSDPLTAACNRWGTTRVSNSASALTCCRIACPGRHYPRVLKS